MYKKHTHIVNSQLSMSVNFWKVAEKSILLKPWWKVLLSVEKYLIESEKKEEELSIHDSTNLTKSVTGGKNFDEYTIIEWID